MNIQTPYSGSTGNLTRIGDLLIDPGVPLRMIKQALNFRLSEISGCLVTHEHGDHSKGTRDLMRAGVDCYMGRETAAGLGLKGHRLHTIRPKEQFRIGEWTILPFPLVHDVECLGFLMVKGEERVLFCTDTEYIPYRFQGLTRILLGIDYDAEILKENTLLGTVDPERAKRTLANHMSISTALNFFRANDMSRVREIWLLHISGTNGSPSEFSEAVKRITGRPTYTV